MKKLPYVSVVIPTYNRAKYLTKCLEPVLSQDYSLNKYQVIVVNDGSKDSTENLLREFSRKFKHFKWISQKNSGPAVARNRGIKSAKGEIIIFIDDDVVVDKDLILRHIAHYKDHKVGGVGGNAFPNKLSWPDKYYLARYLDEIFFYTVINNPESGMGLATANCSYRLKLLKRIGGFNEDFPLAAGEDIELSKRVLKLGYCLVKDPKILAEHLRSETFSSILKLKYKRMSSVVIEEKLGTKAKNAPSPYYPHRIYGQFKRFLTLKKEILHEEISFIDYLKFVYLTGALAIASVLGKRHFKKQLDERYL